MNALELLAKHRQDQELVEILEEDFDLCLIEPDTDTEEYLFSINHPVHIVAEEGAGGCFLLLAHEENSPVIFVGSEGEAGVVSNNLQEFLWFVATCPYFYHDLMRFAGNKNQEEMVEAWGFLKKEVEEDILNLDEIIDAMQDCLDTPSNYNSIEALCNVDKSINERLKIISTEDGSKFEWLYE
ncbi:hypothetical protein [Mangrovibacillus cuniculi]|uniref:Uncharacterized protein n=1 Tax=Mangrovibacillus cuniculi TaxID=2593652 RepID=A0A7S8CDZ4_9BACI|nr:hypothetical protein [Mangrovibacillus cuniculi]QPC48242.1 hypothetical protein G8O30_15610 [Mangrovibacillus cuniculi]